MGRKEKKEDLIIYLIEIMYPFILLFGFYIIAYGHVSPGGGFQGGAILATVFVLEYIVKPVSEEQIERLKKAEELFYISIVLFASLSVITKGEIFTNLFRDYPQYSSMYLIVMNMLIGFKVCLGLTVIFYEFVIHDKRWEKDEV